MVPPRLARQPAAPTQPNSQPKPAIGRPANAGPAEAATRPAKGPFTRSAQERTSAGIVRVGLSVNAPTSLAAPARLLFSVTACDYSIGLDYPQIADGVKTGGVGAKHPATHDWRGRAFWRRMLRPPLRSPIADSRPLRSPRILALKYHPKYASCAQPIVKAEHSVAMF